MEEQGFDLEADSNIEVFGSSKVEFSKPLLVMESLRICIRNRSKEMKKGYTNMKVDKFGNSCREIIPDARKEFISSVKALMGLLSPEIEADKQFPNEDLENNLNKIYDKYAYTQISFKTEKDNLGNIKKNYFYDSTLPKFMPESGSNVEIIDRKGNIINSNWDSMSESYVDECVDIYDNVFAELNKLISRLGYFKKRATSE